MSRRFQLSLRCNLLLLGLFAAGGSAGDGVVRIDTAAPPCPGFSSAEIYHPCDNGTVTDNRTDLVWLADASCLHGLVDWYTALEFVAGLAPPACGLNDNSQPGDWRLPTADEWLAMKRDADGGPGDLDCNPAISNDFGNSCWTSICYDVDLCSFRDVKPGLYWASSPYLSALAGEYAWMVELDEGDIGATHKLLKIGYVWPVRGVR